MGGKMSPVKVLYRDFPKCETVSKLIDRHVDKIEKLYENIVSCNVVVSRPHHHSQKGRIYHLQIRLHLPKADIIINRDTENQTHEEIHAAISDAFSAAESQLEHYVRRRRDLGKNRKIKMLAKRALAFD